MDCEGRFIITLRVFPKAFPSYSYPNSVLILHSYALLSYRLIKVKIKHTSTALITFYRRRTLNFTPLCVHTSTKFNDYKLILFTM